MRKLTQLMDLTGRTAIVTGGAGHIGRAVCEGLVELGATVVVADVGEAACKRAADALTVHGPGRAWPLVVDLADEAAARGCIRKAVDQTGRLDILVHCAGFIGATQAPGWTAPFPEQSVVMWDAAMRINLTAAFILAQEGRAALVASGHGSIILFGSMYGLVGPDMRLYSDTGMANPAAYGASKGGLIQLARYLSTVLAPDVRVNCISPGGVWRDQPAAFHQRYIERAPLARMASEEDLKGAAAYLASDLSAYVTGQNLVVDGGWTAW